MVSFGADKILTTDNADFIPLRLTSEPLEFYVEFYATLL